MAALDRDDAQRLDHRVDRHRHHALGRLLGAPDPERLERRARRVRVEPQVGGDRRLGGQPTEHEVGVGDRRLLSPAPVTGRPGVGARALRADAQRAAAVHPRDRSAAGADRVDVDHRQPHRQPGHPPVDRELGLGAALGEEERVAARAAHVEPERGGSLTIRAATAPPAGTGQQHRRRVGRRLLERPDPAGGQHHVRLREPGLLGRRPQPAEVAAGRRAERGIDGRRRRALELAHLGGDLVRRDHERVRQLLAQDLRHPLLVRGSRNANSRQIATASARSRRSRRAARSTVASSSSRITPSGPIRSSTSTQRRRSTTGGVGASSSRYRFGRAWRPRNSRSRNPLVVTSAVRASRRSSSALVATVEPWTKCVTAPGSTPARSSTARRRRHDALLLARGAQHLGGDHAVIGDEDRVGERAADVDPQCGHARTSRAASSPSRTA